MIKNLLYLLSAFSISFIANAQVIDNTFGTGNGYIINNFTSGVDGAQSVALQNDGKIVVLGTANGNLILVRYNSDGSFDTSFGTNGSLTTHFAYSQGWTSLLVQTDNKIVICATDNYKPFVARYLTDGSLDPTFGTNGVQPIVILGIDNSIIPGMLIDGNGKIVLFGEKPGNVSNPKVLFLIRLNTDGSTDLNFGPNGDGLSTVFTDFNYGNETAMNSHPRDIAFNNQGEIIAQIDYMLNNNNQYYQNYGLMKYSATGIRDLNFGTEGLAPSLTLGLAQIIPSKIKVLADGKTISIARYNLPTGRLLILAKHNTDGSLDQSFGQNGLAETLVATSLNTDLEILPSGKILVAGDDASTFTTILYHPNGVIDSTYGTNGFFAYKFDPGSYDFGRDAVQQTDGKIVIVGATSHQCANTGFALVRLTAEEENISVNEKVINNMHLFPNPTSDYLTIQTESLDLENTTIAVLDLTGKVLSSMNLTEEKTTISLANYSSGVYFIKIQSGKNIYVEKAVKY